MAVKVCIMSLLVVALCVVISSTSAQVTKGVGAKLPPAKTPSPTAAPSSGPSPSPSSSASPAPAKAKAKRTKSKSPTPSPSPAVTPAPSPSVTPSVTKPNLSGGMKSFGLGVCSAVMGAVFSLLFFVAFV